jgi:LPXTG-motif cell wall-anchored protein
VVVNADNTVSYTPDHGFSGNDTFTYTACDALNHCVTKTVLVVVTPVGADDSATTPANTPKTVSVLGNDPSGSSLTVETTTAPSHGTAAVNANGTVTYTPDHGFSGVDHFTYTACDATNQCVTHTVTINVTPTGRDDVATAQPGQPVVISVLKNDDPGSNLTVKSVTQGAHGKVVINGDGTVTYAGNAGFSGVDSFTYTACDPANQCVTRTVTVTIIAVVLPTTGADLIDMLRLAGLPLLAGGLLLLITRRRRKAATVPSR